MSTPVPAQHVPPLDAYAPVGLRNKLTILVLVACWGCLSSGLAGPLFGRAPNIVVVLSDDQGWGDLSLNGNRNLSTPNIDRLAEQGARFDRFFVCPVCSPTRAEFLTGRYHPRSGVFSTSAGGERMDLDERTLGDMFSQAGYATAAFGKWHNGMQYPYHPNGRGFGEYYGFCSGHWGDYFSPPLDHNGKITSGDGFVIDDFTNHALAFMEAHRDAPFLVYLPYNTPHSPMQVPDRWWNTFQDKELAMLHREPVRENIPHTRAALAMCENIDWNVGRIVAKLDELNLTDDTIVIYFCDNGPNGFRWNGGMKGRKGSTDEGGVRSPLIVRWPNKIRAGQTVVPIAAAIDLLPTLADLAGIPVTGTKPLDGVSLKPLLCGERVDWADRRIFSHWGGRVSVRTQQYRLDHQGHLYDMSADPGQTRDVSDQCQPVAADLRAAAKAWKAELLPGQNNDTRPFLIGHESYRYTQMPARDGIAHGNITRSNRFPNCSYFSQWTSTEDKITWSAEVAADGVYEVELHYACPAADIGSTIELRIGSSVLTAKLTKPHDVPPRGGEHDRVERAESYVKDFAVARLGTMRLTKGERGMTLRALSIPAEQAMEFRLLMFTRKNEM